MTTKERGGFAVWETAWGRGAYYYNPTNTPQKKGTAHCPFSLGGAKRKKPQRMRRKEGGTVTTDTISVGKKRVRGSGYVSTACFFFGGKKTEAHFVKVAPGGGKPVAKKGPIVLF